jgi:inositol-phosphate phosphatase / L-galactose 1-phosphate phosphatase / histidinol-phosphatase
MTDDDLRLAERLAEAAGAAIRPFFRAAYQSETKADSSPVTEADRAAEAAIRTILEKERPLDGIIGEEYGATRENAGRRWVIDPIDGTRSFMTGRPIFGTLIALIEEEAPIIGIIDQPILRERWVGARGRPTLFNGEVARTRNCGLLASAHLGTTSPYLFDSATRPGFERLAAAAGNLVLGGDCYSYGLVALGQLDLVVEAGLKLHDFAALVPVVEGAGGIVCDWSGNPVSAQSDGKLVTAGDRALIDQTLALLNA